MFQYHYAGRPYLSARRAHFYIPSFFSTSPDGLPGNDDSGAMGSFVAFSMLGLFPNPGQDVYLITPPFFPEVRIRSPVSGKEAVVRVANGTFDASYAALAVQSATLDGKPYTKNWLTHAFFVNGGVLELTLGKTESDWGTKVEDLPPSLGTYQATTLGTNSSATPPPTAKAAAKWRLDRIKRGAADYARSWGVNA